MKKLSEYNTCSLCPLPWNHFSTYTDYSMRICCNSGLKGSVLDKDGEPIVFSDFDSINDIFNTDFYKRIRRQMLKGERPPECEECHKIEDSGGRSRRISDLSSFSENEAFLKALNNTQDDGTIKAKIQSLDLNLSNVCNLKCITCSPSHSNLLKKEFDNFAKDERLRGRGEVVYDQETYKKALDNYKNDSLFNLFNEEELDSIGLILFSGGEPTLDKKHKVFLKRLIDQGYASKIRLDYNTNAMSLDYELLGIWNEFRIVHLNLSVDAFGELNEYIRKNVNWKKFERNCETLMNHPKTLVTFQTTVGALNLLNLTQLYAWTHKMTENKRDPLGNPLSRLPKHIFMWSPLWLTTDILPSSLKKRALKKLILYFTTLKYKDYLSRENQTSILNFLKSSIEKDQDIESFKAFKTILPWFEEQREQAPIYNLVPEFREFFE